MNTTIPRISDGLVDFYLNLHTRHIDQATNHTLVDFQERYAWEAVSSLAHTDPTGAGHLARAVAGIIDARRIELNDLREATRTARTAYDMAARGWAA